MPRRIYPGWHSDGLDIRIEARIGALRNCLRDDAVIGRDHLRDDCRWQAENTDWRCFGDVGDARDLEAARHSEAAHLVAHHRVGRGGDIDIEEVHLLLDAEHLQRAEGDALTDTAIGTGNESMTGKVAQR